MAEPENFLSRWSRRKLEAEPEVNPAAPPRESGDAEPDAKAEPLGGTTLDHETATLNSGLRGNERGEAVNKEPAFDLTTLPSIESITAQTDIRVFMQKGVPASLTRAALRRAWVADPAIRDFIEMAENQWDFATGSDLPGFGALDASAEDIRRMVADVFGSGPKPESEAGQDTPDQPKPADVAGQSEHSSDAPQPQPEQDLANVQTDQSEVEGTSGDLGEDFVRRNRVDIAMQQSNADSESDPLPVRRPHGRALPQ